MGKEFNDFWEELNRIDGKHAYKLIFYSKQDESFVNEKGTSKYKWKCGSWKDYWKANSKIEWPNKCCIKDCNQKAEDGGHVIDCDSNEKYILPICKIHNNCSFVDEFEIKDENYLVPNNTKLGIDSFIVEKQFKL